MFQSRKKIILISVPVVIFVLFAMPRFVFAQVPLLGSVGAIINLALGAIMNLYVSAVGFAVLQVSKFLITIASYNNFVNQSSVVSAWALVRDIANMVLVLALLVIAFATIFGVQKYSYKQLLPRLLAMAIAINFSRTIAGLMIDFGQVFMLTFVNAWSGAAGGNFIQALKLREILEINPDLAEGASAFDITVGYLIAGAVITVTFIVLLAFALILTLRMVMLWMLIVMAPIVFALSAWPSEKAKKHYGQWWDQFVDNIVVGPAVGFFMWLTLATIGGGDIGSEIGASEVHETISVGGAPLDTSQAAAANLIGTLEHFSSYIIGIGMLVASLKMVQDMRVVGAKVGGEMLSYAQKKAKDIAYKYTGARAIRERYDAFQKMREQGRGEKVQAFAAKAFGAYGMAQEKVGQGLRKLNVGDRLKAKADSLRQDSISKKKQAADYTERAKALEAEGKNATPQRARAMLAENEAKALEAKAARYDTGAKAAKVTQAVAGVGLGAVTGGLSGLAIAPLFGKGIEKKGKEAQAYAESYKYRSVMKEKDALKTEKRDSITAKAQGIGVANNDERMAAMLRMTEEGWYEGTPEVMDAGKKLKELGADEKTQSTFQAMAEKNYQTMPHRDPSGALNVPKLDKAIDDGTLDIKRLKVSELTADNGRVAAEITMKGNRSQFEAMIATKATRDATRQGLADHRGANLDIAKKRGVKRDATGAAESYDDDMQKVAQGIMMAKGDVGAAYGFDSATGKMVTPDPVEASVHKKSFGEAMKGKNANRLLLSVKADQAIDRATGGVTDVGAGILRNISKGAFESAAKEAADNNDSEQMETIKQLLKYIEGTGSASSDPNIKALYAHVTKPMNKFDIYR